MTRPGRPLRTRTRPGLLGMSDGVLASCLSSERPAHPWRSMTRLTTRRGPCRRRLREASLTNLSGSLRVIARGRDEHGLRERVVAVVGEGEEHLTGALRQRDRPAAPTQDHPRGLAALASHFHLAPLDTHPEPRAQGLER